MTANGMTRRREGTGAALLGAALLRVAATHGGSR